MLLAAGREVDIAFRGAGTLAGVHGDGLIDGRGPPVMKVGGGMAKAPERRRAPLA